MFDLFSALPWMPIDGEALVVPRATKSVDGPTAPDTGGVGIVIADISAEPGTDFTQTSPADCTAARDVYNPTLSSYYVRELVGDVDIQDQ